MSQMEGVPREAVPGWGIPTQSLGGEKDDGLFTDRELFSSRGHSFVFKGTDSETGLSGFGYLCDLNLAVPQLPPQFLRKNKYYLWVTETISGS